MIEVTDATFEKDVLDLSETVPVVIDLWAPWCAPCRTLGPMIEKVVDETEGRVALAKVNVDENPAISQAFRVQSIPAVFAIKDRKIVDSFVGALPEQQIRAWVEKLAPIHSPADLLAESNDEASLLNALELDPGHVGAIAKLASLKIDSGDYEAALELIARVPENDELRQLAAKARLLSKDISFSSHDEVEARLDGLLDFVRDDDQARKEYLDLLATFDPADPKVAQYRKALTSRLF
ncbi:MAG: thioredoxin [Actinomycetota bacterium]|jgi:putative thioredoxin|nr:thioredoxin [Actinomycetota bacterium]